MNSRQLPKSIELYSINRPLGLCAALFVLIAIGIALLTGGNVVPSTIKGATLALERMEEWAKWMSGIETAAVAGLMYSLLDENKKLISISNRSKDLAIGAGFFLGLALLIAAWIFSSISSLAIRIHSSDEDYAIQGYDIGEAIMYAKPWIPVRVGFLVIFHHWCWAIGLVSFAAYTINNLFLQPVTPAASPPTSKT